MNRVLPRGVRFIVVGSTAALVQFVVVWILVQSTNMSPLVANGLGFLLAFNVSYMGHRYLTFADLASLQTLRLSRYFLVSASSWCVNEVLYAALLHYTALDYREALGLVLVLVAVMTYFLSRYFACR